MSPAPFNLKDKKTVLVTRCGINASVLADALTEAGAILTVVHPEGITPPPASVVHPEGGSRALVPGCGRAPAGSCQRHGRNGWH